MKNLEDYQKQLGDADFAFWLAIAKRQDYSKPRNIAAECAPLEAEPSNEGITESDAENLISLVVKRFSAATNNA